MAAIEEGFELSSAEQHRLETALQTIADRRDVIEAEILARRANLPLETVREAMNPVASGPSYIEELETDCWHVIKPE